MTREGSDLVGLLLVGALAGAQAMPDQRLGLELVPFSLLQAVGRAASPPTIDARLDDPCWARAVALRDLTDNGGDARIRDQAELRICYDDKNFYFGFFQHMSDLGELQVRHREDATNIWTDSYFEMQFDVAGEHKTGYPQVLINAEGYVFHRNMTPGIQVKSRVGKEGYWIEGSIPFSDLYKSSEIERSPARPEIGERWGFNLCGQASATAEFFCWSNTHGLFRKWAMLGDIVFVDQAPTVSVTPPLPFHGEQRVRVHLRNNAAGTRAFTVTAAVRPACRKGHDYYIRKIRGDDVSVAEPTAEADIFKHEFSVEAGKGAAPEVLYKVIAPGANDLVVSVSDARSGQRVFRATYNIPPAAEVYPVYNFYQDRARVLVTVNTERVPTRPVTVLVTDMAEKAARAAGPVSEETRQLTVDLDTSGLAAGPCQVAARVGKNAIGSASFTIPKRPDKPGRVGLTPQQFLTIDGKPRFVLSLMTRHVTQLTPELRKEAAEAGFTSVQPYWTGLLFDDFPNQPLYAQIADEPSGYGKTTGDELLPRYLKLRAGTTDPAYAILDNFVGVKKVRSWAAACDIVSSDPYPWPSSSLYQVGDWIERCRAAVLGAKPVFVALQAFDNAFDGTGMPTPSVLRAMAYIAAIHRANGIQFFIYEHHGLHALKQDPKLWRSLKETVRELSSLNEVFVAPLVPQEVKVTSERRVDWLLKRRGRETYLFTVNGNTSPTTARFTIPGIGAGGSARVLFENRRVEVGAEGLEVRFKPYERHLYLFE